MNRVKNHRPAPKLLALLKEMEFAPTTLDEHYGDATGWIVHLRAYRTKQKTLVYDVMVCPPGDSTRPDSLAAVAVADLVEVIKESLRDLGYPVDTILRTKRLKALIS